MNIQIGRDELVRRLKFFFSDQVTDALNGPLSKATAAQNCFNNQYEDKVLYALLRENLPDSMKDFHADVMAQVKVLEEDFRNTRNNLLDKLCQKVADQLETKFPSTAPPSRPMGREFI